MTDATQADLQNASAQFWQAASHSFFASAEYYDQQALILAQRFLPRIGRVQTVLDIGCGNGRFTEPFAAQADTVIGYDIAPKLLDEARRNAAQKQLNNLRYEELNLADFAYPQPVQVVGCMGVTSCLIDDAVYTALFDKLFTLIAPGGFLILKDSLSRKADDILYHNGDYIARYRTVDRYLAYFQNTSRSVEIVDQQPMYQTPDVVNVMMLVQIGE